MKGTARLARIGLLALGVAAVAGIVRLGDGAVRLWGKEQEILHLNRDRLSRLQGWVQSEEAITVRGKELFGPFGEVPVQEWDWMGLVKFQEIAQGMQLSVTELRPLPVQTRKGENPRFRVDAKVQGGADKIGTFIPELAARLPGARLVQLQVVPLQGGQVQGILRLEWGLDG